MSKGKVTLGELMGKHADSAKDSGVELHDLPNLLGEGMPKLEFHALGRVRLMQALKRRFGAGYRNIPGISGVMDKFDREAKIELEHHMIKKHLGKKK